ncbi:MAG: alpha/beta hydrolase [Ruminococcus sp.]|nr:alpha/beta hydrolase [Ruminococcus sp.]
MKNIITAAISAAAGKVFRMKTSRKIAIGAAATLTAAAAGAVIAKNIQAKKQERSVQSLVIEDAARRLPTKKERTFEESMEHSAQPFVLPQAVRRRIGLTELDELEDTFVMQPKNKTSDDVIFYLHGSNFWFNPSRYHYAFMRRLANKLGTELVLPVYPKAPAHTVVEIQQMLLDRYLYLVRGKGIPAENIVFVGDAAGGGLALALMQKLRYLALPLPKQAFLISPWLDITNSNPEIEEIQPDDPILNSETLAFKGEKYAGDLELTHPAVSPIYGDLAGLPKMTVFAGTREIFCADVKKLAAIAKEKGLDIDVRIYKNQMHFFVGLPIPEGEEAIGVIASELYGAEEDDELFAENLDEPELAEVIVSEETDELPVEDVEVPADFTEEVTEDNAE